MPNFEMPIDKRAVMCIIKHKDCMHCMQRGANVLELRNVKKSFSDGRMRIDAVKGVDLCFPERGLFFLVGKSGERKIDAPQFARRVGKADFGRSRL